jgi:hypothetical protein
VKDASMLPAIPGPGDPLPKIPTPIREDHRGVDPICTRNPICPFHSRSLDQVIGGSAPIVLLVSTPAFCQVAICGPVLDLLVAAKDQFPNVKMLHAEVYPTEAAAAPGAQQRTPVMEAYNLFFEPVLFLARPDGTILKRIDTIFDGVELTDALTQLGS